MSTAAVISRSITNLVSKFRLLHDEKRDSGVVRSKESALDTLTND